MTRRPSREARARKTKQRGQAYEANNTRYWQQGNRKKSPGVTRVTPTRDLSLVVAPQQLEAAGAVARARQLGVHRDAHHAGPREAGKIRVLLGGFWFGFSFRFRFILPLGSKAKGFAAPLDTQQPPRTPPNPNPPGKRRPRTPTPQQNQHPPHLELLPYGPGDEVPLRQLPPRQAAGRRARADRPL